MVPLELSTRKIPWKRGLLVGLAVLFFATIFVVRIGGDMVDFEVNYLAGTRIREGESLYRTSDGHFMFKYLPFSALCYVPVSFLPPVTAKAVWYALSVVGAILLFVASRRIVSEDARMPVYLVALAPVVLAKFVFRELQLGQINIFVTLLFLWMLRELLSGRDALAGALLGLATAVKPFGLIFFPYFVVRRSLVGLGSGALVLAAALFLPALFYGLEGNVVLHREWLSTLAQSTPAQLGAADNVSIPGFLTKWGLGPALSLPIVGLLAVLVLAVVLRGRGLARSSVLEVAMLLVLIPLVSPLGWDYQLLTSVLAVTLLARHFRDFSTLSRAALAVNLAIVGFSIYDLLGREAYRTFMDWSILTGCFLVVLACLCRLRWRGLG